MAYNTIDVSAETSTASASASATATTSKTAQGEVATRTVTATAEVSDHAFTASAEASVTALDATAEVTYSVLSGDYPVYTGATEVTPTTSTQTLYTASTVLTSNIVINPIPSNYGLITWDGSTLTVS